MHLGSGICRTELPIGFSAGGVNCGVRHYRPDLGMILSDSDCVATAVYTQNTCRGAPVKYCEELLPADNIRAIITNSGQANAMTGKIGIENNFKMVSGLADILDCQSDQVLSASTGVIGEQLSIEKIVSSLGVLANSLSNIAEKFAVSVMTTDLVPKVLQRKVMLSSGEITITGVCKGSGMIHPNMATMLGYLLSDVQMTIEQSTEVLKESCDVSFNMISVDGDTSTNDCVFLMSNGRSGVSLSNEDDFKLFKQAIKEVSIVLAKSIARDGEGASKLIEVEVSGLSDLTLSRKLARSITRSSLVKTAIYGESPNWGRILSAMGAEKVPESDMQRCELYIQGVKVFSMGHPVFFEKYNLVIEKMRCDEIKLRVVFSENEIMATAWGCDLTEKYVKINAEYLS